MDLTRELAVATVAAREAGRIILRHYLAGDVTVETKSDDSPVTIADRQANEAIVALLRAEFPDDALLSEETPDGEARLGRSRVWIVDPLDGTRDFVARTGDFNVHVALAVDGIPTVGVVHHPLRDVTFLAVRGEGAVVDAHGARTPLRVSTIEAPFDVRLGVSRLSLGEGLRSALEATGLARRAVPVGASVKLMSVAEGTLDAVASFTPHESEWDTCAPEVIVREAGGAYSDLDGNPLRYNQVDTARRRGSLASNGACHAALLALLRPHFPGTGP
ncbi:MAG TPA: 3'(2'),5'-bisphosphate nucleotidase CysQ [Polyangia bacterium]